MSKTLLGEVKQPKLPESNSDHLLAETFNKFFIDKILKIRSTIQNSLPQKDVDIKEYIHPTLQVTLKSFKPADEEEVRKIRSASSNKIARIRRYLSNDTCSCIIQGLVTSKLDYANCLLYGVNKVFLHRLQIVQNSAARVILKMRKYDHISRARQELHWLPIQQRIAFSILTDVYKALHGLAPTYITDLILLAQPARLTK